MIQSWIENPAASWLSHFTPLLRARGAATPLLIQQFLQ
jgi:hypothetical protein